MTYETKNIAFLATADCQLKCRDCTAEKWKAQNKGYHLDMEHLRMFLQSCRQSGYAWNQAKVSGGEPLLWHNLIFGLSAIRRSGLFSQIILFSNGLAITPDREAYIQNVFSLCDVIRISDYGVNRPNIALAKKWKPAGAKLSTPNMANFQSTANFYQPQPGAFKDVLPARCTCRALAVFGNRIYTCTASAFMEAGGAVTSEAISTDISPGFMDRLPLDRLEEMDICGHCISNENVRAQMEDHKSQGVDR